MTPLKAIKIECGTCRRDRGPCTSKHCALNKAGSPLQRIKAHCLTCASDHRVEGCTGQIIGSQAVAYSSLYELALVDGKAECPLYPFRYGKNPSRRLSEDQRKALADRGKAYHFRKKESVFFAEGIKGPGVAVEVAKNG